MIATVFAAAIVIIAIKATRPMTGAANKRRLIRCSRETFPGYNASRRNRWRIRSSCIKRKSWHASAMF
jgi:hypothetical protein